MMFKALLANEPKQLLQSWNPDDSGTAKGFARVVGELPLSDIPADFSVIVVGRKSHIRHRARFDPADAGAKGILLAHRPRDNRLKVHDHVFKEVLGQVRAVEA